MGYPDDDNDTRAENSSNKVSVVKVLIYDGDGSMEESVAGLEACLDECNSRNSTGHYFEYDTASEINSNTLSSYEILIMPGGNSEEYLKSKSIDNDAIKQFVNKGKGYLGICAGAYAASNNIDGSYSGWGIAPHINTMNVNYEGLLSISITTSGNSLLKSSKTSLYHENGPAMYANSSGAISFANYANSETGYQDYSAIMGDNYGSGRVLLSGPHPEFDPQDSELLVQMILWATKKS
jgi:glutamine amidotransferase-like uncharacterized protein